MRNVLRKWATITKGSLPIEIHRLPLTTQFVSMLIWPESQKTRFQSYLLSVQKIDACKSEKNRFDFIFRVISAIFSVWVHQAVDFFIWFARRWINFTVQLFSVEAKLPVQFIMSKWLQIFAYVREKKGKNGSRCFAFVYFQCA